MHDLEVDLDEVERESASGEFPKRDKEV